MRGNGRKARFSWVRPAGRTSLEVNPLYPQDEGDECVKFLRVDHLHEIRARGSADIDVLRSMRAAGAALDLPD